MASSLAAGWYTMDRESRRALVREIREVADELARTASSPDDLIGLTTIPEDDFSHLTPRELQVLHALAGGASTAAIARELAISASTVRSYVKSLLGKLGVHSRLEAVTLLLGRELD